MAIALVQSAEGTSTSTTTTAAFSSAPTSGNLIVLAFASDDYNGTPDAGWTQSTGMEQQTWHGGYLWWRISNGTNSFPYTIGSATNSSWVLLEFSGVDSASAYDISAGNLAIDGNSTWALPSITPTSGNRLLVAAHGSSMTSGDASTDATTWSNSFTHARTSGPASATGTYDVITVATRTVAANGSTAYTTTVTRPWTGKQSATGLIIAFKEAAGGGGAVTGSLAATETGSDTASFSGAIASSGSLAASESGSDVAAFTGSIAASGTLAATESGSDTASFAGSVSPAGVTGSLAATESGQDTAAFTGSTEGGIAPQLPVGGKRSSSWRRRLPPGVRQDQSETDAPNTQEQAREAEQPAQEASLERRSEADAARAQRELQSLATLEVMALRVNEVKAFQARLEAAVREDNEETALLMLLLI